ncbi:MAG: hypothetical protein U9N77_01850 [Thermodesulfobacteriota bacterium]|nr:hypothetical protein [Thermodesulfobacteriota bacterium]
MNFIEIIQLRASGIAEAEQANAMVKTMDMEYKYKSQHDKEQPDSCKILKNAVFETDISLHIHWKKEKLSFKPSIFGLCIATALEQYGIINHSIWQEE